MPHSAARPTLGPATVDVAAVELLARPRVWTPDESRRDAPAGVPRVHVYGVERSAISSSSTAFPADGAMLFAFAGTPLDPGARYAVIDEAGFAGIAVSTGEPCPPGQRDDLPCTFADGVHGYAHFISASGSDRPRDGAIAIGPWHGAGPTRARLTRNLAEPTQAGPYPAPSPELTLDLVDLDGDGAADLATTIRTTWRRGTQPPCRDISETLLRHDDGWYAVEWDTPACKISESWTDWLIGLDAVDRGWMGAWVGAPVVGERLVLLDRRGTIGEIERVANHDGDDMHGRTVSVRALRSPTRRPAGPPIAIGPTPSFAAAPQRARIIGGLFARRPRNGVALPLGDVTLFRVDLDGDRRSDLEARNRDCWIADREGAQARLCVEIVMREGSDWRVIARTLQAVTAST